MRDTDFFFGKSHTCIYVHELNSLLWKMEYSKIRRGLRNEDERNER